MVSLQCVLHKSFKIIIAVAVAITTISITTITTTTTRTNNKIVLNRQPVLFAYSFTIPITIPTTTTRWTRNKRFLIVPAQQLQIQLQSSQQQQHLQQKSSQLQLLSSVDSTTSTSTTTTTSSSSSSSSTSSNQQKQQHDELKQKVLIEFTKHYNSKESQQYTETYDFENPIAIQSFYSLFKSIRTIPVHLGLHPSSIPFSIKSYELSNAITNAYININRQEGDTTKPILTTNFINYFTMNHLQKALNDDFLDAARGSIDNRKGWKIYDVSQPRGNTFEDARMTFSDVTTALEKGTVILNAAGAHIPLLAEPSLVCTDTTVLPCSLNLYITSTGKRTSAPPHTDKQDVVVIQTSGIKKWKVYSVPDPSIKPHCDIFARGKMDDNLPLYTLESNPSSCQLLIDTILYPGDVLFIPAGYPHTTSTVIQNSNHNDNHNDTNNNNNIENSLHVDNDNNYNNSESNDNDDKTSIHLTVGIDHHIWELDYINARTIAYRRAGIVNKLLLSPTSTSASTTPFTGKVNELPSTLRSRVLAELPLGLLDDDENNNNSNTIVEYVINELEQINKEIDIFLDNNNNDNGIVTIDYSIIKETIVQLQKTGIELLNIHRDMYIAAINEGRIRDAEAAMMIESTTKTSTKTSTTIPPPIIMTPERMQRLSLFRVKQYYDRIDRCKKQLLEWSYSGNNSNVNNQDFVNNDPTLGTSTSGGVAPLVLPTNWAYTMPLQVGDKVEAELAGAMFDATITTISSTSNGQLYDVLFFDGDKEYGLLREQIKLLTPPSPTLPLPLLKNNNNDSKNISPDVSLLVDTSKMTSKQLKRWKKEQQQNKNDNYVF